MPRLDMPLEELRKYRPTVSCPDDFDAFWERTLAESRAVRTAPVFERLESPLRTVEVFDVTYSGFGGDPIRGWLVQPAGTDAASPRPAIVTYIGYGGGRQNAHEHLAWASAGYVNFVMDTRGQGSTWGAGSTPDPHGSGPNVPGYMTLGIDNPDTYYYRRVYADAVLALDVVAELPQVDAARIAVGGGSQGGGISIAAAALSPHPVVAMPDVPFLCHFERAVGFTDNLPYAEITKYLSVHRGMVETVFHTLSYFDGVNFASRATAKALFSVALMDPTCIPSSVYAAFNHWGGEHEMVVYPFNEHEGGGPGQWLKQAAFVGPVFGV